MRLDDVIVRARGLASHLLDRAALVSVASTGGWQPAARRALDLGFPAGPAATATPLEFDREVGRVVGRRLGLLWRWLGPRAPSVQVLFSDDDRRNLRILLRGAAQGAPPAVRLGSTVPTPSLPAPLLERLADAASPAEFARRLLRLGHPAGRALSTVLSRPDARPAPGRTESASRVGMKDLPPSLFGLEIALHRSFVAMATTATRRAGRATRRLVAMMIDRDNTWSLLVATGWRDDLPPCGAFLPGGDQPDADTFDRIARLDDPEQRRAALVDALGASHLAAAFAEPGSDPAMLEARALQGHETACRVLARHDPLGVFALAASIERIRIEGHDLRLIVAGLAMGAPPETLEPLLATTP